MKEKLISRLGTRRYAMSALLLSALAGTASAVSFTPHELFRLPFGSAREQVGARAEQGQFLFPRDFTIDGDGHFYIYDATRHRIVRYSFYGKYEMAFSYPATATQIFAHPDSQKNLWMLVSDPTRGLFYGVYDERGKLLRSGLFSQFSSFRLRVDDEFLLHVMLSASNDPKKSSRSFVLDEQRRLMVPETVSRPPENHHEIRRPLHKYFIDQIPDASSDDAIHRNRITDDARQHVNDIAGTVVYVTDRGDIYTRVGPRQLRVYDVTGRPIGTVQLQGLRSACATIRFDADGNIYELDGIPSPGAQRGSAPESSQDPEDLRYTGSMPGLRLIKWQRE